MSAPKACSKKRAAFSSSSLLHGLFDAVLRNRCDQVKNIVRRHPETVNERWTAERFSPWCQYSVLMLAAELGYLDIVQTLLDAGATDDYSIADTSTGLLAGLSPRGGSVVGQMSNSLSALFVAILRERREVVKLLVSRVVSADDAIQCVDHLVTVNYRTNFVTCSGADVLNLLENVVIDLLSTHALLESNHGSRMPAEGVIGRWVTGCAVCPVVDGSWAEEYWKTRKALLSVLEYIFNVTGHSSFEDLWRYVPAECAIGYLTGNTQGEEHRHDVLLLMMKFAKKSDIAKLFLPYQTGPSVATIGHVIDAGPEYLTKEACLPIWHALRKCLTFCNSPCDKLLVHLQLAGLTAWLAAGINVNAIEVYSGHIRLLTIFARLAITTPVRAMRQAYITTCLQLTLAGCRVDFDSREGRAIFDELTLLAPSFAHALVAVPSLYTLCVKAVRSCVHRPITRNAERLPLPKGQLQADVAGGILNIDLASSDAMATEMRKSRTYTPEWFSSLVDLAESSRV